MASQSAHLRCCARYPRMCTLHHFTVQYMCALCHEMCIQNDVKQLTSLSTFSFTLQLGSDLGILQFPPLIYALSSVHHVPIDNKISKILKKMWVFYLHCILMLPSSILRTVPGPLDLYNPYGSITELFDFPVQNVHQMHLESAFLLHLDHIPINNMISIMHIFI
jgi:hypothetical protein